MIVMRDVDAGIYDAELTRILREKLELKTRACQRLSVAAASGWAVVVILIVLWIGRRG